MSKVGPMSLCGRRFGRLVVQHFIRYVDRGAYISLWKCVCDCGNIVDVRASALYTGNTKSCGCLRASKQPKGQAGARRLFCGYKQDATKRALDFNISFEQFVDLTSRNCFYCGASPSKISICRSGYTERGSAHSVYTYNGIDRLNSDLGYLKDNLVSCCRDCNIAKSTKTVDEFLEWAKRLVDYQKTKEEDLPPEDDRSTV